RAAWLCMGGMAKRRAAGSYVGGCRRAGAACRGGGLHRARGLLASAPARTLVAVGGPGASGLVDCRRALVAMARLRTRIALARPRTRARSRRLRTRIASPWPLARSHRPRVRLPAQRIEQLQRLGQIAPILRGLPPAGHHPVLPFLSVLQVGAQRA